MDNSYRSHKKRSTEIDETTYLPSAEKSQLREYTDGYLNRTPMRNQYIHSAKKSQRTSEAKRAIDEVIDMISEKRRLNEEAISEIKNVNNEIVGNLSAYGEKSKGDQKRKTSEQFKNQDTSRDYVTTSSFDWRQSHEQLQKSQKEGELSQQNLNLRSRLNEQIKRNNELYRYISTLETENNSIRASRPATSEASYLAEENRVLRQQLALYQTRLASTNGLFQELERLKEQNNLLRKETIQLLQNLQ